MAEESAVNYWEVRLSERPSYIMNFPALHQKYGHIAFDSSQKAVLTSCVVRYKPAINSAAPATPAKGSAAATANSNGQVAVNEQEEEELAMEEGFINCCFSFTIRRDKWGIPSMIVGNFIRC